MAGVERGGKGSRCHSCERGKRSTEKGVRVFISRSSVIIEFLFINKNNKIITTKTIINHTLT